MGMPTSEDTLVCTSTTFALLGRFFSRFLRLLQHRRKSHQQQQQHKHRASREPRTTPMISPSPNLSCSPETTRGASGGSTGGGVGGGGGDEGGSGGEEGGGG